MSTVPKSKSRRSRLFGKVSGLFTDESSAARPQASTSQTGVSVPTTSTTQALTILAPILDLAPISTSTLANAVPLPATGAVPSAQIQISSSVTTPTHNPVQQPPQAAAAPSQSVGSNGSAKKTSMWDQAIMKLSPEDQKLFNLSQGKLQLLNEILVLVEREKDAHRENGYTFEWRGETVNVRDITDKICSGVNKFIAIGDNVVQIDTAHGALPWAGIRLILQCGLNSNARLGSLLLGIAKVANMIPVWTIYEDMFLGRNFANQSTLEAKLSDLYALTLKFLIKSYHFFIQNTAKRLVKSALISDPVPDYLAQIKEQEIVLTALAQLFNAEFAKSADDRGDQRYENLRQILQDLEQPLDRIEKTLERFSDNLDSNKRIKILKWISEINYGEHYKVAVNGLVPGTCDWLLRADYYKDWCKFGYSDILWLQGDPGVGKTRLTARVVKFVKDSGNHHAYFFCKRGEEANRQIAVHALRAMIKQLSMLDNGFIDEVLIRAYDEDERQGFSGGGPSTIEECTSLLVELLNKSHTTYLILDALDECELSERQIFLSGFQDLLTQTTSVKIFISSRFKSDILIALQDRPHHVINPSDNSGDIERFVQDWLKKNTKLFKGGKLSEELRAKVGSTLLNMANGMFQWVVLAFQHLWSQRSEQQVQIKLGKLPNGLEKTYDQIFEDIYADKDCKDIALGVLKWVMASYRPLTTDNILEYIRWIHGDEMEIETVLGICQNLLVVDYDNTLDFESRLFHGLLRYSHLSVREYLLEHKFNEQDAHIYVAKNTLEVSGSPTMLPMLSKINYDDKWEMYCRYMWPCHVKYATRVLGPSCQELIQMLSTFLGTHMAEGEGYKQWNITMSHSKHGLSREIYPSEMESFRRQNAGQLPYPSINIWQPKNHHRAIIHSLHTPLAIMCYYNLVHSVSKIWEDFFSNAYQLDPQNRTKCLQIAAHFGHLDLVKYLLVYDEDVDYDSRHYGTALLAASKMGFPATVDVLLKHGANPDFVGSSTGWRINEPSDLDLSFWNEEKSEEDCYYYGTACCAAVASSFPKRTTSPSFESLDTLNILLDHKADINLPNFLGKTPLYHAVVWQSTPLIIRHLLEKGADPNVECLNVGTPLMYLIQRQIYCSFSEKEENQFDEVLELLLEFKADINKGGGVYGSPLGAAMFSLKYHHGSTFIIKTLLRHGADPNMEGGQYSSPYGCLLAASKPVGESARLKTGWWLSPATAYAVKKLMYAAGLSQNDDEDGPFHEAAKQTWQTVMSHLGASSLDAAQDSIIKLLPQVPFCNFLFCNGCKDELFHGILPSMQTDSAAALFWCCIDCSVGFGYNICCACETADSQRPAYRYHKWIELHRLSYHSEIDVIRIVKIDRSGNVTDAPAAKDTYGYKGKQLWNTSDDDDDDESSEVSGDDFDY